MEPAHSIYGTCQQPRKEVQVQYPKHHRQTLTKTRQNQSLWSLTNVTNVTNVPSSLALLQMGGSQVLTPSHSSKLSCHSAASAASPRPKHLGRLALDASLAGMAKRTWAQTHVCHGNVCQLSNLRITPSMSMYLCSICDNLIPTSASCLSDRSCRVVASS